MQIQDCMTRDVATCRSDASMEQAAGLMWEHDCGLLPVVDEERLVGVLTDRDVCMGAYTCGKELRELRVRNSMSKEVFTCRPTDPLELAVRTMADHQVRRVPVVGEHGELVGIVSLNDVVRHVVTLRDARERARLSARVVEALAVICETRRPGEQSLVLTPARPKRAEQVAVG